MNLLKYFLIMKNFNIEIIFDKKGKGHIKSTDIQLSPSQIETFQSLPPYYDNIVLNGYVDGHHLMVETCTNIIDNNQSKNLSYEEFEQLIYESIYTDIEWLINRINYDSDY